VYVREDMQRSYLARMLRTREHRASRSTWEDIGAVTGLKDSRIYVKDVQW
jgi:hypothetical protein